MRRTAALRQCLTVHLASNSVRLLLCLCHLLPLNLLINRILSMSVMLIISGLQPFSAGAAHVPKIVQAVVCKPSLPLCLPNVVEFHEACAKMPNSKIKRQNCRLSLSLDSTLNCHFVLVQQGVYEILGANITPGKATMRASAPLPRFWPNPKLKLREQLAEV